jgi:hypothetical protein
MCTCDIDTYSYDTYVSGINNNHDFSLYDYLEDRLEYITKLFIFLGAVFGWVYIRRWGWCFVFKYWFVEKFIDIVKKYIVKITKLYFSGFMSEARGLHWVRNNES